MTNKEAFGEAKKYIPGGVDSPVRAFGSVGGEPFIVERGEGAYLIDVEGKRYLDFIQSWGPLIFGHCDDARERSSASNLRDSSACRKDPLRKLWHGSYNERDPRSARF